MTCDCQDCKKLAQEVVRLRELLDTEIVLSMRLERELKENREWLTQNGHPAFMHPVKVRKKSIPYGNTNEFKNRYKRNR